MKTLIAKSKLLVTLSALVAILPIKSFAAMTLANNTPYIAQYVVIRGNMVVARIPGIAPNAQLQIPTENNYEVTASTIIDGNTYVSTPINLTGAGDLTAAVHESREGTYDFNIFQTPQSLLNSIVLRKTTINPVQFTILSNGRPVQSIVLNTSEPYVLSIESTYYVYAVINGVTTDIAVTTNPNAVITAQVENSPLESGYFFLDVQ